MSDDYAVKAQEICPDITIGEHRVNHDRTREAIASALRAAREEERASIEARLVAGLANAEARLNLNGWNPDDDRLHTRWDNALDVFRSIKSTPAEEKGNG